MVFRQYNRVEEFGNKDIAFIMDLAFDVGDAQAPVGHALLYFTSSAGDEVFATYVQIFPIPMNLAQYMPPAFASLVPAEQFDAQTAAAMPPVAQVIEGGLPWLRALAGTRRDDLVNAGELYSTDQINVIAMTQQAAGLYDELYRARGDVVVEEPQPQLNQYADLTEGERLAEMTRLVGRLRDELGSQESDDAKAELVEVSKTLPAKYRADELADWASQPGEIGQQLATLHLQRSYKLLNEEYLDVANIERQIQELQTP